MKSRLDPLLAGLPDIALVLFFTVSSIIALNEPQASKYFAKALSGWMIFEMVGIFVLLLWVALNEGRPSGDRSSAYRFITTCSVYFIFGLVMHYLFRFSQLMVLLSAVGGVWALVNPYVRKPEPTVFQRGRETAMAMTAMLLSFFAATLLGGIVEQCLDRPYRYRATFDALVLLVMGAIYYSLRWWLVYRFTGGYRGQQTENAG